MWLFGRRKKLEGLAETEAAIHRVHSDTMRKIDKATNSTKKLNEALDKDNGVTYRIFLATGGSRRK